MSGKKALGLTGHVISYMLKLSNKILITNTQNTGINYTINYCSSLNFTK